MNKFLTIFQKDEKVGFLKAESLKWAKEYVASNKVKTGQIGVYSTVNLIGIENTINIVKN